MHVQEIKATLITGRTLKQGIGLEKGKLSNYYIEQTSYVEMNEEDLGKIGKESGDRVSLRLGTATIKLECRKGTIPPGLVFIPYGPLANRLIGTNTDGTGMPDYKGLTVLVSGVKEEAT
jgi:formylmethanofuran dehydrogenase subunit D